MKTWLLQYSSIWIIILSCCLKFTTLWITLRSPQTQHTIPLLHFLHWLPSSHVQELLILLCFIDFTISMYLANSNHIFNPAQHLTFISKCISKYLSNPKYAFNQVQHPTIISLKHPSWKPKHIGQWYFSHHSPVTWKVLPLGFRQYHTIYFAKTCLSVWHANKSFHV